MGEGGASTTNYLASKSASTSDCMHNADCFKGTNLFTNQN